LTGRFLYLRATGTDYRAHGRILIKPAVEKSGSLDGLHQILAEEIPGESEREQFLKNRDKLH
jgi:hypothetical protein